ncbi:MULTISPECIES: sensor histidine kinase [Thiorhodovibrio]|uniref:sensor histidine kinase n=1 Tax=Thiorhodovibrio TaxID=61593 RepID=UPI001F5CD403|nr:MULTISPECIES: HAMP domain-containing sensor histidine kinase [Thiorhodovibrio]WPL13101.1 Alkaline phosphatase synthesis sensor protein PhoR [Thiorhodovibrio litoralis]
MHALDDRRARRRLKLGIGLFVLALAIPSALLVLKAYDQMKWESFRAQQLVAEELAARIDERLAAIVRTEEARPIDDYSFLRASQPAAAGAADRSPLAALDGAGRIPGLIGYFEVADDGRFSSPLVPRMLADAGQLGLDPAELAQRQARAGRIQQVLIGNRLVERAESDSASVAVADEKTDREGAGAASLGASETAVSEERLDARQSAVEAPSDLRPELSANGTQLTVSESEAELNESLDLEPIEGARQVPNLAPAPAPTPAPTVSADDSPRLSQAAFARLKTKDGSSGREGLVQRDKAPVALPQLDDSFAKRSRRELKEEAATGAAETPAKSAGLEAEARKAASGDGPRADSMAEPEPQPASSSTAVQLFHRSVGPIEVGLLDSGHLLLFRSVRRGAETLIQGALIEQATFLQALIGEPLAATVLAQNTHLSLAYRGELLSSFRAETGGSRRLGVRSGVSYAEPLSGALLYRTRLREPFGGFELIFSVSHLPPPPGALVIGWMAATLALVLFVGAWLMYRLAARQLALLRQQQDFVSAVSHELKTPLTSIRMYAEMLRAGLAPEKRKETYYRFIQEESERLSRLINNVLQLARIGRGRLALEPRPVAVGELLAMVRERVAHQLERVGFELRIDCASDMVMRADPDACVQILLNLVDNAVKFGADASERRIDIACEPVEDARLRLRVRDFGPGIPQDQRKRVFDLFYRGDQARHAAVSGTGIGLALVQRLMQAMHGRVEVIGREPGVEFWLEMPLAD